MADNAERTHNLILAVATSIVNELKGQQNQRISNNVAQSQIANAVCSDGTACEDCLTHFTDPRTPENRPYVQQLRTTACRGVCLCNLQAFQDNFVTFSSDIKVEQILNNPETLDSIVDRVQADLEKQYGPNFRPSYNDIRKILKGDCPVKTLDCPTENINTAITRAVNQTIAASQVVNLAGAGDVIAVNQSIFVDAIMNALLVASIQTSRQTVTDTLSYVREQVNEQLNITVSWIWNSFLPYWIALLVLLGLSIILVIAAISVNITVRTTRRVKSAANRKSR